MKLFEFDHSDGFDSDNPLRIGTTAVLSQIKAEIDDDAYRGEFTVDALLKKLRDNDINVSHKQLFDLIKEEPWSNLIANIKGNKVIFKGEPSDHSDAVEPDETTDTLDKMAKRSAKKKDGLNK